MRAAFARLRPVAPLVVASLALSLAVAIVWRCGYVGLSNDDAARLLIARAQSRTLTLDPTRSSWLPIHSWTLGLLLRTHASMIVAARALSLASGVIACVSTALVLRARGASAESTTWTTLLLALWPWSVVAAASGGIPEMPCVAWIALALVVLEGSSHPARFALAGLLLSVAAGHRYEAWWATVGVFVVQCLRRRAPRHVVVLGLASAVVPFVWLGINAMRHGDALEFVHRVERFRQLEGPLPSVWWRLGRYPSLLLCEAPALLGLFALGLRDRRARVDALVPLVVVLALVWGDFRGGGPTHHASRALLVAVWLMAPTFERGVRAMLETMPRHSAHAALALGLLAGAVGVRAVQSSVAPETLAAGRTMRAERSAPRWLIDLDRQDFLWVEVCSEAPERAVPDRVYGAAAPDAGARAVWARAADLACVSRPESIATLEQQGFRVRTRRGPWTILSR